MPFRWWFGLGLLFAGHFVGNLVYLVIGSRYTLHRDSSEWLYTVLYALYPITTSQPVLLAMWATFGRQRLVHRAVLTVSVLVVLTLGPIGMLWLLGRESYEFARALLPNYVAYQAAYFALASALFLLVRSVVPWEIVPPNAPGAAVSQHRPAILTIRDLLGLIVLSAGALATVPDYREQYLPQILVKLLHDGWYGVVALSLLPLCLATDRRRVWRWLLMGLGLAFGVHAAESAIPMTTMVTSADKAKVISAFAYDWGWWLLFFGGFLAAVALSLWLARLAGFRLITSTNEKSSGEAGGR